MVSTWRPSFSFVTLTGHRFGGLYAEPGVKYYFDNGSRVVNFFKDKPLNLNLQVGLRLNITK